MDALRGYEDVNDAERLDHDPMMRQVVGLRTIEGQAVSTSQMSRFETEGLATGTNRAALADLNGQWIDRFLDRAGLMYIVLDMDSSVCRSAPDRDPSRKSPEGIDLTTVLSVRVEFRRRRSGPHPASLYKTISAP
jgi:hypothetical protein